MIIGYLNYCWNDLTIRAKFLQMKNITAVTRKKKKVKPKEVLELLNYYYKLKPHIFD